MTKIDPRRRILNEFGADDEIVGVDTDYSIPDLKLFLPALLIASLSVLTGNSLGGLLAVTGGIIVGLGVLVATAIVVFIAPSHLTPQVWVGQIIAFKRQPSIRTLLDGASDQRTETLTRVDRFLPEADAVERVDGTLVAGVEVSPANMALATETEWDNAADALGNALNALDFPFQLRSTARRVDADRLVAGYDQRRDDPDVTANPVLANLIDAYRRRLPQEFQARGTSVREYQILVPVYVYDVQIAERGALANLRDVPYIGGLLGFIGAESTQLSPEEIERAQRNLLDNRLATVQDAIRGIDTCTAERVSAETLAAWIEESWAGSRTEYETEQSRLRTTPVVLADAATTPPDVDTPQPDVDDGHHDPVSHSLDHR
ncbi:hypothetical protein [Halomicrococcus sp. NG-SE-24]|uniref:hypothetical protein n=1 Tax=Halomicrococcus sp. NG-SE-24 TaxID=3436928 RepID=UPI003D99E0FB